MYPRHRDSPPATFGRLSAAKFDHCPSSGLTSRDYHLPPRNTPSPHSDASYSPPSPVRCITPPQAPSFLERHAISTYNAKKTQLPLSVYELPTATYMWARWTPKEEEPREREPVIFVRYRPPQCDTESTSGLSRPPSRSSFLTSSSHPSPASTPPPTASSRKRSSSAESDNDSLPSPSDRFLKHPRYSHHDAPRKPYSARSASPQPRAQGPSFQLQGKSKESPSASSSLSAESDPSVVELRLARHAHQSNSSSNRGSATLTRSIPPAPALAPPQRDEDQRRNEWMNFVHPPPETSPGPDFTCTWQVVTHDGITTICGYGSKKHLVKRHIESKHLQLRPCVCPYCGKGFAQKSNLDTHINTHTGIAPHRCHYCDERFKDPARRHRHMIQVHKHRSSRLKKDRVFPDEPPSRASPAAEASESNAGEQSTELLNSSDVIDDEAHSGAVALCQLQKSPSTPSSEFA